MMRSSLVGGSIVLRPGNMAARAPSRLPSTVHLPRCTGGLPHRLTAEPSDLPKMAAPCTTALVSPWVDDDDVTEISIYEVIAWSAEEAMELIKQTPPPHPTPVTPASTPAPAHDVGKLVRKYERLLHRAEAQSIDMFIGSKRLVQCHLMAWEAYETVRPVLLGLRSSTKTVEGVLMECINRGNVNNDRRGIEPRLLAAFGVKTESLPTNPMERHFVAGVMYAAMETRNCVRRRVRRLRRVESRNRRREEERETRKEEEEEEEEEEKAFERMTIS